MTGLSELFIVAVVISFLGSLLAGTVFLVWVRGKQAHHSAGDGAPQTKFRSPDWQYAVVCGTGVLFVLGMSFPIEVFLGREESNFWIASMLTVLLIAAVGFIASWLVRRSSRPVAYSRWAGPAAAALLMGALCSPCLMIPAALRGSREQVRRESAERFMSTHPVAKLLISGTREADFKEQLPSATFQEAESNATFGLRRYHNQNYGFDFLDERLLLVGWREIKEDAAYQELLAEISAAFGSPESVPIPKHRRDEGVKQLSRWRSADADLEIEIALFDSREGKTEYGAAFTRLSEEKTLNARKSQAANR